MEENSKRCKKKPLKCKDGCLAVSRGNDNQVASNDRNVFSLSSRGSGWKSEIKATLPPKL